MAVVPQATVSAVEILPDDVHNARLLAQAHPRDWHNPVPRNPYNLVVIGAGPAGLTAAQAVGRRPRRDDLRAPAP
jgi:ribulose 1,5-bisphosphate synthetase/thiazole synthase